ncbi:hypothetical protein L6452_00568 [Arctium lappa]|uniref:Uncharacterized protein n=1 Tax=Arctium lappa TaxID=4217 RepID=A0ACB9FF34_ARCLA|nr:hypothetical protein L6452_00568 [Arctium lappa]
MLDFSDAEEIHTQYVNRRWMRGFIPLDVLRTRRIQPGSNERSNRLTNDMQFVFDQILSRVYGDEDKLELFLEKVRSIKSKIVPDIPSDNGIVNKDVDFEKLLGVSKPTTIEIRAPEGVRKKKDVAQASV